MTPSDADGRPAIVVRQDFRVSLALVRHHRGADLAQSDAVAPTGAAQDEAPGLPVHDEGRTVKMRAREGAADFKLLADDHVAARAGDAQPTYPARGSARKRL